MRLKRPLPYRLATHAESSDWDSNPELHVRSVLIFPISLSDVTELPGFEPGV